MKRPPGDRHGGPVGQLGRLVSDLILAGHRLEYTGPRNERIDHAGVWIFSIVACDREGREIWRVEERDAFEWVAAQRAHDAVVLHIARAGQK